jgi:hypothetical protein
VIVTFDADAYLPRGGIDMAFYLHRTPPAPGLGLLSAQIAERLAEERRLLQLAKADGDDLQEAISQTEIEDLHAVAERHGLHLVVVPKQGR